MAEHQYKFRIKTAIFEIEIEGDRNYVERLLNRYENQYMIRFRNLLEQNKPMGEPRVEQAAPAQSVVAHHPAPHVAPQQSQPVSQPQPQTHPPHRELHVKEAVQRQPREPQQAKGRSRGGRGRGGSYAGRAAGPASREPHPHRATHSEDVAIKEKLPELKTMFSGKDPKTHQEKVLLIGYFLDQNCAKKEFDTIDVADCYNALSTESPSYLNSIFSHATRTGLLTRTTRGGKITFSLTPRARQFVEKDFKTETQQSAAEAE